MLEADNMNMTNLELEVIPAAPATSTITSDFDNTQFQSDHTYTQSQPNSYSSEPQPPLGSVPSTQPLPSRPRRPRQRSMYPIVLIIYIIEDMSGQRCRVE
ncbi:hypothetical protein EVAR_21752_1 [Eumeta japonica]|uniref:Uncharacterized protein n=1 Tax=Eumeta variegata TaxID=151549 RepID=A0A4C1ZN91_EUMVA|nr:hypothetical protein EVAR_21752_1 [Eumeta japonica]